MQNQSSAKSADQIARYFEAISRLMSEVLHKQRGAMHEVAELFAAAVERGNTIYITGCSHSSIFAQEVFYRAGGFMLMNPLFLPGMMLGTPPVTLTTRFERISGIAEAVLSESPIRADDVLIVASVSGRNDVPVELALHAREKGVKVVALTSTIYSSQVRSRHASGQRLFELADHVLDMMSPPGDAMLDMEGLKERTAPSSTVIGVAMLHAVISQAIQLLLDRGVTPPVFMSANVDGADAFNRDMLAKYKNHIHYM
ncbi:sugar isomerase domain-containing protein [Paenibacillus cymbidii]|uniref:sugar isomerase domain-containing protein n=1 Tax=Paenibacillus cymbidii TaxID=1639034 RepID=UPI001080014E|nr:SIS domain-containing protein [Paenibacillus cymbidii]